MSKRARSLWLQAGQKSFLMGYVLVEFLQVKKRVMRYGTSRRVVLREKPKKPPEKGCRLIHPEHPGKRAWDIFIGALLIYTALFVPFRLAFEDEASLGVQVWDFMVDGLFLADIVLTFCTGFFDRDGYLVR